MKRNFIIIFLSILANAVIGQSWAIDSCFTSSIPDSEFDHSADLISVKSADLLEWTGNQWIGALNGTNITIPPPFNCSGTRAIFLGSGAEWTTGGESASIRLNQPLVSNQSYSLSFTYVSHGMGSNGRFSPKIYSSPSGYLSPAVLIDSLSPAGYEWTTSTFTFTTQPNQDGHQWIIISTDYALSSGLISSFCTKTCTPIDNPDLTKLQVFPSPFSDEVTIIFDDNKRSSIVLYDTSCKEVLRQEFTNIITLNTVLFAEAVYIYKIITEDGEVLAGKIVKQ